MPLLRLQLDHAPLHVLGREQRPRVDALLQRRLHERSEVFGLRGGQVP